MLSKFFDDLNGSISQKWKRLRKCCASLRGNNVHNSETSKSTLLESTTPNILVSTPHTTSSLRIPNNSKRSSVQDVLRAKLSQIHVGNVRQECILSPVLFNLYVENVFAEALEGTDCGIKVNGYPINNIRDADDTR
uniref:Uncharacterized protein LOC114341979 n=1 Tax=Diabrotica virgifera virgifera TaxID=50390 RepID=A0A6P7GTA2_DIAVI